jgi:L-seryl-tRNA(Ser) seleniumtransferase
VAKDKAHLFRKLPAVDKLLLSPMIADLPEIYSRSLTLKTINQILDELRQQIIAGKLTSEANLEIEPVANIVAERLEKNSQPSLRPVINASGVIVHTNLGRSILADRVIKKLKSLAGGYSNLEYDIHLGVRGSRHSHIEEILKELTGAEGAMVVNNNAAAVLVCLETLARGRKVIVSRGQLVEIGGSFRIPDVMQKSGARMIEVGTTNKTHLRDYEEVIDSETALLLKVHKSNFDIVGFAQDVLLPEMVALGKRYGIPVMEDLGSGCLINLSAYGLTKEPTVQEILTQGADLVTFSGDKLLGGPQAGIILGRKDLVEAIKTNQLSRALRVDKLTLLALEETLRLYRDEQKAVKEIPTLRMILQPYKALTKKADRLVDLIGKLNTDNFSIELADGNSKAGGGALPLLELPCRLVCIVPQKISAQFIDRWFRNYADPIITRIEKERVLLDVRTIPEKDLKFVAKAVNDLAGTEQTGG